MSVVLPQPLGPSNPTTRPVPSANDTPRKTSTPHTPRAFPDGSQRTKAPDFLVIGERHEHKFHVPLGNTQPPLHRVRNSRSYAGPPAQRRPFERTTDMNRPRPRCPAAPPL